MQMKYNYVLTEALCWAIVEIAYSPKSQKYLLSGPSQKMLMAITLHLISGKTYYNY